MAFFIDGPVKGQVFEMERHPYSVRITEDVDDKGEVKQYALDCLEDIVGPNETATAYRRVGKTAAFVDYTDRRTGRRKGRRMVFVNYAVYESQPPAEVMRDNGRWQRWCLDEFAKFKGESNGVEAVQGDGLQDQRVAETSDVR